MKWAKLNKAYAGLSFSLDVPSHRRRKESLEKEMTQLEKDIKSLQGKQVVVVEEHAGQGRA
jgi:predicted  nucleic acid-binding Zn-ribbon protein